jgi:lipoprotein Spr
MDGGFMLNLDTHALAPMVNKLTKRSQLGPLEIDALLAMPYRHATIEPGRYVIREGDEADSCVLLCSGFLTSSFGQKTKQGKTTPAKTDVKFLEDISVEMAPAPSDPKAVFARSIITTKKAEARMETVKSGSDIEQAGVIQFKYAQLMDMEVEQVQNINLFKTIDDWMGTRYRLGGSGKDGIDCSALMQVFFTSLYGITLPRTAREQYSFSRKISRGELREGDLVFFNTIGGVSHVGMYLQNNKFVHASSNGVTISDLYEEYWLRHFVGVGRVENSIATVSTKP